MKEREQHRDSEAIREKLDGALIVKKKLVKKGKNAGDVFGERKKQDTKGKAGARTSEKLFLVGRGATTNQWAETTNVRSHQRRNSTGKGQDRETLAPRSL